MLNQAIFGAGLQVGTAQEAARLAIQDHKNHACWTVHGPDSPFWKHSVLVPHGFLHPDAEGKLCSHLHSDVILVRHPYCGLISSITLLLACFQQRLWHPLSPYCQIYLYYCSSKNEGIMRFCESWALEPCCISQGMRRHSLPLWLWSRYLWLDWRCPIDGSYLLSCWLRSAQP